MTRYHTITTALFFTTSPSPDICPCRNSRDKFIPTPMKRVFSLRYSNSLSVLIFCVFKSRCALVGERPVLMKTTCLLTCDQSYNKRKGASSCCVSGSDQLRVMMGIWQSRLCPVSDKRKTFSICLLQWVIFSPPSHCCLFQHSENSSRKFVPQSYFYTLMIS